MVETATLPTTLEAEGYELEMSSPPSKDYKVLKGSTLLGMIRVELKQVKVSTSTGTRYVPYDLNMEVLANCSGVMPSIDFLKKIIMASVTIS